MESQTPTKLEKLGIDFLDAPVSGGEPKAIDGTLAFMVGGEKEVFNRIMPFRDDGFVGLADRWHWRFSNQTGQSGYCLT